MESADVVAAILNGDLDDDVTDVIAAIRKRQRDGAVDVLWRIEFEGLDITEENLTVGEAKMVEAATSESIITLPVAGSAKNIAAVVAAALINRSGLSSSDAFELVGKVGVRGLLKSVTEFTVANPPKDGSVSETSGSSPPSP